MAHETQPTNRQARETAEELNPAPCSIPARLHDQRTGRSSWILARLAMHQHLADSMVWLTAPGLGDDIQAAKAGVLEVADVFVVNKSDLQGADETAEQLRSALHQAPAVGVGQWQPEVLCTSAVDESGAGEFLDVLDRHLAAAGAADPLDGDRG